VLESPSAAGGVTCSFNCLVLKPPLWGWSARKEEEDENLTNGLLSIKGSAEPSAQLYFHGGAVKT
jgi:hypothetical protein